MNTLRFASPPATETAETTDPVSKKPWPKACEVLNVEEELAGFKLDQEGDLSCDWRKAFENGQASKATVSDTTVGSRKTFEIQKETSSDTACKIAVPADGGHMSVYVRSNDLQESCDLAKEIAEKAEPKLPA